MFKQGYESYLFTQTWKLGNIGANHLCIGTVQCDRPDPVVGQVNLLQLNMRIVFINMAYTILMNMALTA